MLGDPIFRVYMPDDKKKWFDFKNHRIWAENLTIVMQVGLTMAGCVFFCFWIGRLIDRWLGTKGIFVVIFTILGVVGGASTVYRQILKVTEDTETKDPNNGVN